MPRREPLRDALAPLHHDDGLGEVGVEVEVVELGGAAEPVGVDVHERHPAAAGQRAVRAVHVDPKVTGYVVDLCRATRQSPSLQLGVSPRGATALLATARAWAWLSGRSFVSPDEVKAVARPTLRHRMIIRPELELDGITADGLLDGILATVPAPR